MSARDRQGFFRVSSTRMNIVPLVCAVWMAMATACGKEPPPRSVSFSTVSAPVVTVGLENIPEILELSGTVRAARISVLSSKVPGRITAILVREGDRVRQGQVLARIDDRETAAGVAQAQASLQQARFAVDEAEKALRMAQAERRAAEARHELAQATFKRFQALMARESVSRQEFDEVKAKFASAAADVDRARQAVKALQAKKEQALEALNAARAALEAAQAVQTYAEVTAPMDALVTAKHVEVGQMAAPGLALLTVEDYSAYRLEVPVPERVLSRVRVGDAVPLFLDFSQEPLTGRVVEVLPSVDSQTRSGLVKISLPSPASVHGRTLQWRTGTFARARFITGSREAITVPASAVVQRGQLTGVFVVDDEQVCRWRLVRTGRSMHERVEILAGLKPGEQVVAPVVPGLEEGLRITAD
ncbi:efflux RND transporter periplasmic adaptor subunit [Desulfosoma caldarium]|uniref:RND family efflux transporter MFP subunit n=1 Tax=Desulfosoma caldarium TaxID=610254 RepID=A0A3N1ULS8_9BACT|nr:efflux RND transporter periplasmic adaptor subunit [Desulfosoma caldarium]ROQ91043.1 RND family efflux transporter MFP subunit [Desulfosoma caldarium]